MPEPILDAVALRVMAFAHPRGIEIMLSALNVARARCPAEVYARDEHTRSLDIPDEDLSEVARGLRYAMRRAQTLPSAEAERYRAWLRNAAQLADHFERGALVVDFLTVDELARRVALQAEQQVGRGEAACLVLAKRLGGGVVFLSSDENACRLAAELGVDHLTLIGVLRQWTAREHPDRALLGELVAGMRAAKFGLPTGVVEELKRLVNRA